jgi:Tol biopolymer transport system component
MTPIDGGPPDIGILTVAGQRRTQLFSRRYGENNAEVSPDGGWLAYQSDESTVPEIYVRPFPNVNAAGRQQVSAGGGTRPLWSRDGRELFYFVQPDAIMAVPAEAGRNYGSAGHQSP